MAADVKCTVSSCSFWAQANRCDAKEILVDNSVAEAGRMEIGSIAGEKTASARQARHSHETCCKTFRPK